MALHVEIEPGLVIPDEELTFRASRSGGPGGQHVNKVSTKITLEFDVAASRALSDAQRERIRERLGTRLARGHLLHVSASRQRSQAANRREALERFAELLRRALAPVRPRRATRVPAAELRRRLEVKRQRGERKRQRRVPGEED